MASSSTTPKCSPTSRITGKTAYAPDAGAAILKACNAPSWPPPMSSSTHSLQATYIKTSSPPPKNSPRAHLLRMFTGPCLHGGGVALGRHPHAPWTEWTSQAAIPRIRGHTGKDLMFFMFPSNVCTYVLPCLPRPDTPSDHTPRRARDAYEASGSSLWLLCCRWETCSLLVSGCCLTTPPQRWR